MMPDTWPSFWRPCRLLHHSEESFMLRSLRSRVTRLFTSARDAVRDRSFRPSLGVLEDRQLPTTTLPTPAHIVVVVEENHAYSQIIGSAQAPYINSLAHGTHAALFTQSYGVTHPSQPNYLYLFSGSNQGVTDDNEPTYVFSKANLGAQLLIHHLTFEGYADGLPSVGFTGATSGNYARKHAPWVDWQGTGQYCLPPSVNQPFTAFPTDYTKLPTVSFVIPNLQHDMHNGTVQQGDTWLKQNLNGYVQWAKTHNSLLILTFDEDDRLNSNHITTVIVGAGVKAGTYKETINHLNVLATIETLEHLPRVPGTVNVAPITNIWTTA
jgi:hypothetical protein